MRGRRIRSKRQGPQSIGDVLARLLARRGYAAQQQHQVQQEVWKELAGSELAGQSRPGNLKGGVLEILVRSSSAIQELSFQKRELVRRLQQAEPQLNVRDLRFRIAEFD